jgi:cytochrome oxidase Cu insertion factor (SCO1/SenC/PrrC family)
MRSRSLAAWLAVMLTFAGGMSVWFAVRGMRDRSLTQLDTHHIPPPSELGAAGALEGEPLASFQLTDQKGAPFRSEQLDGRIWVGSIFFASCPSTCRVQNLRVAELQQRYGSQGVEFVSITCDPERDTPARLADYSLMFGADPDKWHFLTGQFELIKRIGTEMFGITVEKEVHSDRLVLFDREGKIRGAFRSTDTDQFEQLKEALDELLAEEEQQVPRDE